MGYQGLIYKSGQASSGDIDIWKIIKRFRKLGLALIFSGLAVLAYIYAPIFISEIDYVTTVNHSNEVGILEAREIAEIQEEAKNFGVDSHYSIYIPKIDVGSTITSNVDAGIESEYSEALKNGIAHAKGTSFPGMGENVYLFSHSTDTLLNVERYNAKFYLLNKLENTDRIVVYFSDKKYIYEVFDKKIVDPADITSMNKTGQEVLTLQTCYPPGTSLKRLIVYAKPYTQ